MSYRTVPLVLWIVHVAVVVGFQPNGSHWPSTSSSLVDSTNTIYNNQLSVICASSKTSMRWERKNEARHTTRLKLFQFSPQINHAFRAASSLGMAASLGRSVGGDASILVTLCSAALLSNTLWAPVTSPLYDACWRYFLPGSLVLLLLSLSPTVVTKDDKNASQNLGSIRLMAVPFAMASLASLVGCLVALSLPMTSSSTMSSIFPPPTQALLALSCLVASFIGGSVNFMATARIIGTQQHGASAQVEGSLLSAMAAADLIVMAVYFGLLGVAAASPRLRAWVTGQSKSTCGPQLNLAQEESIRPKTLRLSIMQRMRGSIVCLGISGVLVQIANFCEDSLVAVLPGTACGVLAILTPLIRRYVPPTALAMTAFWSEFSFLTLFASIGLTAHIQSALSAGSGCLILSLVALLVHVLVLLLGTTLWNRSTAARLPRIDLDTVLIASNAAIGGPATAAAWAARTAPQWALAATFYGTVGYATGTTVGVWFYGGMRQSLAM